MAEAALAGRTALVVGHRADLLDAIEAALAGAGATVLRGDPDPAAVARATAIGGRLDVLVHVSAPSVPRPFRDRDADSWADALASRLAEPIALARDAAAAMARTGGGAIVFVGTLDATHAYAGHADASVAMGALGGLVRSLALELAPDDIRADLILAGPLPDASADAASVARTLQRSPSGRPVTPQEVASAVLFVAGPGAGFMTGSTLRVDGGWASLNQAPDGMRFR